MLDPDLKDELGRLARVRTDLALEVDVPLAVHSTMGIGGRAAVMAKASDLEGLRSLLELARGQGLSVFILGGGSNVLFDDEGVEGFVVRLGRGFETISSNGSLVTVGAGVSMGRLLNWVATRGLSGLESVSGLPGTLGGAVRMNAGGQKSLGSLVKKIRVMDRQGKLIEINNPIFEYRHLALEPDDGLIVEADLALETGEEMAIRAEMKRTLDYRAKTQPKGRSAGCIFKNPDGNSAGRLIDECGLKGRAVGGARVSDLHANFIVNEKGATAGDVKKLMAEIKGQVLKFTGLSLSPEIRVLNRLGGRVEDSDYL